MITPGRRELFSLPQVSLPLGQNVDQDSSDEEPRDGRNEHEDHFFTSFVILP